MILMYYIDIYFNSLKLLHTERNFNGDIMERSFEFEGACHLSQLKLVSTTNERCICA